MGRDMEKGMNRQLGVLSGLSIETGKASCPNMGALRASAVCPICHKKSSMSLERAWDHGNGQWCYFLVCRSLTHFFSIGKVLVPTLEAEAWMAGVDNDLKSPMPKVWGNMRSV